MLYLIGLGLHDEKDISLKGLDILKKSDEIYAEFYTNVFCGSLEALEKLVGKKITLLNRSQIEDHPEETILKNAKTKNVALLVSGDPMVATTHIDLVSRATKLGIKTKIIHSSSVYSAIAETGLQIYKFGKTTTLAFSEKSYSPTSPYDVIKNNKSMGLHTLVLLDIKADQKRYMTVNGAIDILLKMEEQKKQDVFNGDTLILGIARLGSDNAVIKYGTAIDLKKNPDFGDPPHVLVIPGELHFMEEAALKRFLI